MAFPAKAGFFMAKILAIGAHSDDIEFYAGATLVKLAAAGNNVVFVVVTNGEKGGDPLVRKLEQKRAAQIMEIRKIIYLNYPDGELEYKIKKLKRDLLKVVLDEKPKIIFSFDPHNQFVVHKDFHPDHRALAISVTDVVLIDVTLAGLKRPKLWFYNSYKPNKKIWSRQYISKKFLAISEYKSQNLKPDPTRYEKFRVY